MPKDIKGSWFGCFYYLSAHKGRPPTWLYLSEMLFVNRETECTPVQSMCSEILATSRRSSLKPLTQLSVGKQVQEHAAQVSGEHTGDSMIDRKGEQDEWVWTYVSCGLLETRLLNSRAREAPWGLRQEHLSNHCQKQEDGPWDQAQPTLESTFLPRWKGHFPL